MRIWWTLLFAISLHWYEKEVSSCLALQLITNLLFIRRGGIIRCIIIFWLGVISHSANKQNTYFSGWMKLDRYLKSYQTCVLSKKDTFQEIYFIIIYLYFLSSFHFFFRSIQQEKLWSIIFGFPIPRIYLIIIRTMFTIINCNSV